MQQMRMYLQECISVARSISDLSPGRQIAWPEVPYFDNSQVRCLLRSVGTWTKLQPKPRQPNITKLHAHCLSPTRRVYTGVPSARSECPATTSPPCPTGTSFISAGPQPTSQPRINQYKVTTKIRLQHRTLRCRPSKRNSCCCLCNCRTKRYNNRGPGARGDSNRLHRILEESQ